MADNSFTQKTVRVTVVLGQGSFGGGGNAKTIEGFGTDATITKPGLPEKNKATVKVTGLKYDDMAQMTMLAFKPLKSLKNLLTIQAGDAGDANPPIAFKGEITSAFADFNTAPDVTFNIEAQSGSYPSLIPSPQETVRGQATAESLIGKYAAECGYSFKNEGVTGSIKNAVLNGSPVEKMRAVADQVGCELMIDDDSVVIMPPESSRSGNAVYLSKDSGLLGYPTFNADGIVLKAIYQPDFQLGGLVQVKSIVPRSSGTWKITKLSHTLSAFKPQGGPWRSDIEAIYVGG